MELINGQEIFGSNISNAEKELDLKFETAIRYPNGCIIFIDEIDCISNKNETTQGTRVLNKLCNLMDKLWYLNCKVFVIAATSKPNEIDSRLRRQGR